MTGRCTEHISYQLNNSGQGTDNNISRHGRRHTHPFLQNTHQGHPSRSYSTGFSQPPPQPVVNQHFDGPMYSTPPYGLSPSKQGPYSMYSASPLHGPANTAFNNNGHQQQMPSSASYPVPPSQFHATGPADMRLTSTLDIRGNANHNIGYGFRVPDGITNDTKNATKGETIDPENVPGKYIGDTDLTFGMLYKAPQTPRLGHSEEQTSWQIVFELVNSGPLLRIRKIKRPLRVFPPAQCEVPVYPGSCGLNQWDNLDFDMPMFPKAEDPVDGRFSLGVIRKALR
jgi:hypothetical protein